MTRVEEAIYAATFAAEYDRLRRDPPDRVFHVEGAWGEWELEQAAAAVELATYAVERFRECAARVREGFAGTSALRMYRQARAR